MKTFASLKDYNPQTEQAAMAAILFDMLRSYDHFTITEVVTTADKPFEITSRDDTDRHYTPAGSGTVIITARWVNNPEQVKPKRWKVRKAYRYNEGDALTVADKPKKVWEVYSADGLIAEFKSKSAAYDCAHAHNIGIPPEPIEHKAEFGDDESWREF